MVVLQTDVNGVTERKKYVTVTERADDGSYSAYVPDLPGCVAVGQATPEAALRMIGRAVALHIKGMQEDGLEIPEPTTLMEYIEIVV